MPKLIFRTGTMESGKSLDLLKVKNNYDKKNKKVVILTSAKDDRAGVGIVSSRIGISSDAIAISKNDNILEKIKQFMPIDCVLVDECQFFSEEHIDQLSDVVDFLEIPVICYGLRSDYKNGNLFPGSERLFGIADTIEELRTICHCGKKAVMNALFIDGIIQKDGNQVVIEKDGVHYESLCRKHWKLGVGQCNIGKK